MTTPQHYASLAKVAERIVRDAVPATDSGATCFVPRYQIDQLKSAIADAFDGGTGMINVSADGVERIAPEEFRKSESHSAEIHRKAREMAAAEYDRDGRPQVAQFIRSGAALPSVEGRMVRAIERALSLTPPAAAPQPQADRDADLDGNCGLLGPEQTARINEALGKPQAEATQQPAIPEGFTPWGGGECPEDARGRETRVALRNGNVSIHAITRGEGWEWRHYGGDGDIIGYCVEQPATCKPDLQVQPEAKAGADDDCAEDAAVWNLIGIAEKCGAKKDSDDNSTWWVLDVRAFYALEEVLRERVSEAMYRESEPAEGGAVPSAKVWVAENQVAVSGEWMAGWDACRVEFPRSAPAGSGEAAGVTEWIKVHQDRTGTRYNEYRVKFPGDVVLPDGTNLYPHAQPAPVESLGRDAEGVEALAKEVGEWVTEARNEWAKRHEQAWLESETSPHPDDYAGEYIARRLTASDARPVVDEAMVDRAYVGYTKYLKSLGYVEPRPHKNALVAALTAALNPSPEGDSNG